MRSFRLGFAGIYLFLCVGRLSASSHWQADGAISIGGEGGWDYALVQPEADRLYVAHQSRVVVIDLKSRKEIGSIPGEGVHGTALAPELNRGFVASGKDGTVRIFDLVTLQAVGMVPAAPDADAICYEPVSRRVFSFNGDSQSATVIDAVEGKSLGDLPLGGKPEFARADGHGSLFANLEDKDEVVKIDGASRTITATWPLPAGSSPSSMAIDAADGRLFVGCRNQTLLVLDDASGKIVATLPVGKGIDASVYDPKGRRIFSSCGDGTMTVIRQNSADSYAVAEVLPTAPHAHTMAFDPDTETLYVPSARFGPVPDPTPENPKPRPPVIPGSFQILVFTPAASS